MAHFEYGADYGKGGTDMFQLSSLALDGQDVVNRVDQGVHLRDEEHLIQYLSEVFGITADQISVESV
jgi:hypothetical protein